MKYEIKNILVPTDFSSCSNNALRVAIGMAKRHNAIIHLIHVVEPIYLGRNIDMMNTVLEVQQIMLNDAYKNLSRHKQRVWDLCKVQVETFAAIGTVSTNIVEYAVKFKVDIVVMGTHGVAGFKEYFVGTNTYDVIKNANCPVLSIPESFDEIGFQSILFPIRAVDGVIEKYDYIKPIIEKNDASIHLLGIVNKIQSPENYAVKETVDVIKNMFLYEEKLITYEMILADDIANKVLEIANQNNNDLIIINATLDKKWFQFFKGNFTQRIINHATIPILSVKPSLTPEIIATERENLVSAGNYYTDLTLQLI